MVAVVGLSTVMLGSFPIGCSEINTLTIKDKSQRASPIHPHCTLGEGEKPKAAQNKHMRAMT